MGFPDEPRPGWNDPARLHAWEEKWGPCQKRTLIFFSCDTCPPPGQDPAEIYVIYYSGYGNIISIRRYDGTLSALRGNVTLEKIHMGLDESRIFGLEPLTYDPKYIEPSTRGGRRNRRHHRTARRTTRRITRHKNKTYRKLKQSRK